MPSLVYRRIASCSEYTVRSQSYFWFISIIREGTFIMVWQKCHRRGFFNVNRENRTVALSHWGQTPELTCSIPKTSRGHESMARAQWQISHDGYYSQLRPISAEDGNCESRRAWMCCSWKRSPRDSLFHTMRKKRVSFPIADAFKHGLHRYASSHRIRRAASLKSNKLLVQGK